MLKTIADITLLVVIRTIVLVLRIIPENLGRRFCSGIINLFRIFFKRLDKAALINLGLVYPHKSEEEKAEILRRSYETIAKNIYSFAIYKTLSKGDFDKLFEHEEAVKIVQETRSRSTNGAIIIATLHFGEFEILVQSKAIFERPTAILAKGFGLERLDRWWNEQRGFTGNTVFYRKGAFNEMLIRLEKGDDVSMLIDQNVKKNHAVFCDFLGINAATTKSVALASLKTGAKILFTVLVETNRDGIFQNLRGDYPQKKYHYFLREVVDPFPNQGTIEEQILRITQNLNAVCSEAILQYPESWMWMHRRFKTRPEGEPENFYPGF